MASGAVTVKQEPAERPNRIPNPPPIATSSDSSSTSSASSVNSSDIEHVDRNPFLDSATSKLNNRDSAGDGEAPAAKRTKRGGGSAGFDLPLGFLRPLPLLQVSTAVFLAEVLPNQAAEKSISDNNTNNNDKQVAPILRSCKQFCKAGDYDGGNSGGSNSGASSVGMDHVRIHPKFLHSNATSHKWALGAFAELLDNALDEKAKQRLEESDKEQSVIIEILVAERAERDKEEERLRKSLMDASNTIDQLLEKVRKLGQKLPKCKVERE